MKTYSAARAFVVILVLWALIPTAVAPVLAQGGPGGKPSPIDTYPLPSQPGVARYSLVDRWNKTNLTFRILNCPSSLDCATAQAAIRQAFKAWSDVSALTFQEVRTGADIEVQWTLNSNEFGQPGGVLAYAYYPSYGGDLFIDDAETWTVYGGRTDLYITAIHEIGHALGLDHSDDKSAVMYPYLIQTTGLGQDDIAGIQRLYGPNTGSGTGVVVPATPDTIPTTSQSVETVDGTITNTQYYQLWTIDAHAGETVTLTMETLGGDLDAYLGLLSPDRQTLLAEDDDGLGSSGAQITYTFPSAGNYVIVTTRYDFERGTTSGNYRLTAQRGQASAPAAPAVPTPAPPQDAALFVTNYSGVVLCGVFISPSGSQDWGPNQLTSIGLQTLGLNVYATWQVPVGTYDVLVMDCYNNTLQTYMVGVAANTEVQVYETGLVVR